MSASDHLQPKQFVLDSLNPTGSIFVNHDPSARASAPLAPHMVPLHQTLGGKPDESVQIHRGVPSHVSDIRPGDFVTTNRQLARDYAGDGKVISRSVPKAHVLDDATEPGGEEYIYRPQ